MSLGLPRHLRTLARRQEPAHGPVEVPRRASPGGRSSCEGVDPCVSLYPAATYYGARREAALAGLNPLSPQARELKRLLLLQRDATSELDSAGRVMLGPDASSSTRASTATSSSSAPATASSSGTAPPGRPTTATSRRGRLTSPHLLAILLDMPRTHVPVLAGRADRGARPAAGPGRGRLHARRRRPRAAGRRPPRPAGTLIAIDRDPLAEEAFAELAAEVAVPHALHPRRLRARPAHARRGGRAGRPRLPRPRHVLDAGRHARARLLLRLRRAAGHADGPRARSSTAARDRQHLGPPPARARAARVRRGALRRPDRRRRSSAAAPLEHHASSSSTRSPPRSPRPRASPAATPPSAPSRRSGSPSTTSSPSSTRRCRWPGTCCAPAAAWPRISFHSLEDRRVKRFLADRARGCICPPDLPVCGCGRTPEAELVFRRSVAPTPGEVAANPRSKSARLRAARKLKEEH